MLFWITYTVTESPEVARKYGQPPQTLTQTMTHEFPDHPSETDLKILQDLLKLKFDTAVAQMVSCKLGRLIGPSVFKDRFKHLAVDVKVTNLVLLRQG